MKTSLKAKIAVLTVLVVSMSTLLPTAEAGRSSKGGFSFRRSNSGSQSGFRRSNKSNKSLSIKKSLKQATKQNSNKNFKRNLFQNSNKNLVKQSFVKNSRRLSIKKTPTTGNSRRNLWKNNIKNNKILKKFPVQKNLKRNFSLKKNRNLKNLVKKHWNQQHNWKGQKLKHWNWGHWNHDNHHHKNWFHWDHKYSGHWGHRYHSGWGIEHHHHHQPWHGFGLHYTPVHTYYNPYCVSHDTYYEDVPYFDYSQPLEIGIEGIRRTEDGVALIEAARFAFARGEYIESLRLASFAAQQMPNDPDVHQLRSIILFAMGDFKESAAAANVALNVGPGWSWDAIRSLYGENPAYNGQYRGLERFVAENPNLPEGRFLLGYHYMMLNFKDAARRELDVAVRLQPRDQVSGTMLKSLVPQGQVRQGQIAPAQPRVPAVPPVPQTKSNVAPQVNVPLPPQAKRPPKSNVLPRSKVPPQSSLPPQARQETLKKAPKLQEATPRVSTQRGMLLGNWTASPDAKTKISLVMKENNTFEWNVQAETQKTSLKGTFELVGDKLVLKRGTDSQKLEGKVKSTSEKEFVFTLIVNGKDAMAFNFVRS